MRVLVTGATGFIGQRILDWGAAVPDLALVGATRGRNSARDQRHDFVHVGELGASLDWRPALEGVDAVVHTAARAHVTRDRAADPLAEYRRINVAATEALARQAATAGVRRLVFISSIKVNGERTMPDHPFRPADPPRPEDPYGVSKAEAETALRVVAAETGLDIVIVRPVLVYGPGVKGNFRSMMRWLQRGIPLPLGAVRNRRSLVALDNLVDLVFRVVRHQLAANQTFLVSDGVDFSTTELLRMTAEALGVRPRLVPVLPGLLAGTAHIAGLGRAAERLLGSLQVDISHTRRLLDWTPPVAPAQALAETAKAYLRGEVR